MEKQSRTKTRKHFSQKEQDILSQMSSRVFESKTQAQEELQKHLKSTPWERASSYLRSHLKTQWKFKHRLTSEQKAIVFQWVAQGYNNEALRTRIHLKFHPGMMVSDQVLNRMRFKYFRGEYEVEKLPNGKYVMKSRLYHQKNLRTHGKRTESQINSEMSHKVASHMFNATVEQSDNTVMIPKYLVHTYKLLNTVERSLNVPMGTLIRKLDPLDIQNKTAEYLLKEVLAETGLSDHAQKLID